MKLTREEFKNLLQESDRKRQELIERCRQGEKIAFEQFIRMYQDSVFSRVCQTIEDERKALDVTRDVFVQAYKTFPDFEGDTPVDIWLFNIVERCLQPPLRRQLVRTWQKILSLFPKKSQDESPGSAQMSQQSSCQETEKLLDAYVDGELSELEVARVDAHLKTCPICFQKLERLEQTEAVLWFHMHREAPETLLPYIQAKLDELAAKEKERTFLTILNDSIDRLRQLSNFQLAAVAAGVVIVFCGIVIYQSVQRYSMGRLLQQHREEMQAKDVSHQQLSSRLQRTKLLLQEIRSGNLTADTSPEELTTKFVIITGNLTEKTLSLQGIRKISHIISEDESQELSQGAREPVKTEFLFIPGGIETVKALVREGIEMIHRAIPEDTQDRQEEFIIHRISAFRPEHSIQAFSQFLKHLEAAPEQAFIPPAEAETLVVIYIIDKR